MSALHRLQQDCEHAFSGGDTAPLLAALVDNAIPAATRIKVYQNNAAQTFRKTLLNTYPVVAQLVGDACFSSLAHKYTGLHPSTSGDLQHFGRAFAELLDAEYAQSEFAYLSDVARLELALEEALLAPESDTVDLEALARVRREDLADVTFTLAPSLRLVGSSYPILSIWRSNQPGRDERVDLRDGAECVAVRRVGDEAEMQLLDRPAFDLASALAGGASLRDAWAVLTDDARERLTEALQSLAVGGCLSGFSLAAR